MKKLNQHQQDLIDRLFERRLPQSEQEALEEAMKDETFREEVRLRQDLRQAFSHQNQVSPLKKRLQERERRVSAPDEEQERPGPGGRVVMMRRVLAVAAAVLLLVVAGWFGREWLVGAPVPVALEFLDLPKEHSIAGESPLQLLLDGRDAFFRSKRYGKAANYFTQIESDSKFFSEAQYLLAHSMMQQRQFTEAVPLFDSFLTDNEKFKQLPQRYRNQDRIRFERMLAYLGAGQDAAFQPELNYFLQHPDNYYQSKAQAIAQRLEDDS